MVQEPPASIITYEVELAHFRYTEDLDYLYVDGVGQDVAAILLAGHPAEVAFQPGDGTFYGLVFLPLNSLRAARPRVVRGAEWERHAVRGMGNVSANGYGADGFLVSYVEHACYPLRLGERGTLAATYIEEHWNTNGASAVTLAILFRSISWWLDNLRLKAAPEEGHRAATREAPARGKRPCSIEEASVALRAAAWREEDSGRYLIHSFAHADVGGGVALGADHDLDEALARLDDADEIAWVQHPFGHNLAVLVGDRVLYFQVEGPSS